MLTEAEAKTKWCPFARQMFSIERKVEGGTIPVQIASANLFPEGDDLKGTMCLASGCMVWRWTNKRQTRGFCGLAGSAP